jgi:class 3 adenylate cyclase
MAFKFRHKLLLALTGITLFAIGAFVLVNMFRLHEVARLRTRQTLESAQEAFLASQRVRAGAIGDSVASLVQSAPDLQAVLAGRTGGGGQDPFATGRSDTDDEVTLESTIPFTALWEKSAQVVVADISGHVLLLKDKTLPPPAGDAALADALRGNPGYTWWRARGDRVLQIFSAPVRTNSGVVGAILVGYPVDRAFLEPLEKVTGTRIELAGPADAVRDSEIFESLRGSERYLGGYVSLAGSGNGAVGRFLILRPLAEEEREAARQMIHLVSIAAVILVIALLVALYLSSLVSRPLEALGRAVREVGAGNFRFRLNASSKDEFGQLGNLIDEMAAGLEERERIRAAFGRYVDDDVVREVLKNEGAGALEGREKDITVLFADLANFTAFSEGKSPRELLRDLNAYFGSMARAVEEHKGILDKFIGDAIMAYWGAPLANPRHAEHACRAALAMATRFQTEIAPRYPKLGLRIGVAAGGALVGNVGSEQRQNYTVMGDTVNLASRLEGVNKAFGTQICVSSAARELAGDGFRFRRLGRVRVAGRSEPEAVYELVSEGVRMEVIRAFEEAVTLFERGEFGAAAELLQNGNLTGDAPSRALLGRCTDVRKHDRREGSWDGVWNLGK